LAHVDEHERGIMMATRTPYDRDLERINSYNSSLQDKGVAVSERDLKEAILLSVKRDSYLKGFEDGVLRGVELGQVMKRKEV